MDSSDPLPPPEPPPKCITPCNLQRDPYFNRSETTDEQIPLDIETRPLGVNSGGNSLFFRKLPSDNVMREIVGEVPLWGSLVGDWIDSHNSSKLVYLYCQVGELYTSHSPSSGVKNGTLVKSKARKTVWRLLMQIISSPACLLGESSSTLALIGDSGASVCISP